MKERLINLQVEFNDPVADWFETFVGKSVIPVLQTGLVKQYWFGQYFDGAARRPRVRFLTHTKSELRHWNAGDAATPLELEIEKIAQTPGFTKLEYDRNKTRADYYSGTRFLSPDATDSNANRRAKRVFDYLNSVCVLYVESLVGPDANGRFRQESSQDENNPHHSIFETLHHLLCNTTNVTTEVASAQAGNQLVIEGRLYWEMSTKPQLQNQNIAFNELGLTKVRF